MKHGCLGELKVKRKTQFAEPLPLIQPTALLFASGIFLFVVTLFFFFFLEDGNRKAQVACCPYWLSNNTSPGVVLQLAPHFWWFLHFLKLVGQCAHLSVSVIWSLTSVVPLKKSKIKKKRKNIWWERPVRCKMFLLRLTFFLWLTLALLANNDLALCVNNKCIKEIHFSARHLSLAGCSNPDVVGLWTFHWQFYIFFWWITSCDSQQHITLHAWLWQLAGDSESKGFCKKSQMEKDNRKYYCMFWVWLCIQYM